MTVRININVDGKVIIKDLTAEDQLAFENDIADIGDWIDKAIDGKVNNTRKRMVRGGIADLRKAGVTIPADDNALINTVVARPGYKNRAARDAEGI